MFALDLHFALLAAQCMLSLLAFPSPATAIALHSPHSDHREFSGSPHTRRRPSVLLAPSGGGKGRHSSGERGSSSVKKTSRKHMSHDALAARTETSNRHVADVKGGVGKTQPRDQQFFQTRESGLTGIVIGVLNPLLGTADSVIKGIAGSDPLAPLLVGRHHRHDDHLMHQRSVQHTHRPTKRDQQGVPGNVNIIQGDDKFASLALQAVGSTYELIASRDDSTTMYLVQSTLGSISATNPLTNIVQLQVPISGQGSVLQPYCATFDPNPPTPSPLTAEPCFLPSQANEHKSQIFTYDSNSGYLQPMHSTAVGNGGAQDALTPVANAKSENVGSNLTEGNATRMWARDLGLVNLMFDPLVPLISDYSSPSSETLSVTTVTVTETTTQANPSSTVAGVGTSTSASEVPESTALSSASQSSPGMFDVDVALPSATSSSVSPEASNSGDSSSSSEPSPTSDPDAIAASIASTDRSTARTSEASPQTTPASLLVQITRPDNLSTSTPAPASTA